MIAETLPEGIASGRVDVVRPYTGITVGPAIFRFPQILSSVTALSPYPVFQLAGGGTITYTDLSWIQLRLTAELIEGALPVDTALGAARLLLSGLLPATRLECGTVTNAWCPGFTDVSVEGRKLAGIGILTRGNHVIANITFSTMPVPASVVKTLDQLHGILGKRVLRSALTSLAECVDRGGDSAQAATRLLMTAELQGYSTAPL